MGSEPVSRTPPWPLLQFLPLGSYLELLGPLDDRLQPVSKINSWLPQLLLVSVSLRPQAGKLGPSSSEHEDDLPHLAFTRHEDLNPSPWFAKTSTHPSTEDMCQLYTDASMGHEGLQHLRL